LAAGDFANQIYDLRRQQGRLAELGGMLKLLAAQYVATPLYQVALAQMFVETGELDEARARFGRIAAKNFEDFREDQFWIVAISVGSEVCADLQDVARAKALYGLLLPYADLNVVLNGMVVAGGSASRNLGQLASVLGRWDEAQQHFEHALEMNARLRARPFLVHTQYEYAKMLISRGVASGRARAIDLLDEALASARTLGMTGVVRKAEALRLILAPA
jgi:tetratricopeptide (TPR) repeat protein